MTFGKEITLTNSAQTNSSTTISTNGCGVDFVLSGNDTSWLTNVEATSSNRLSFTASKNNTPTRLAVIQPKINNTVCNNESKWVLVTQESGCECETTLNVPTSATTTGFVLPWNSSGSSQSVTATIASLPCIDGVAPTFGISGSSSDDNFNVNITSKSSDSVNVVITCTNNNTSHSERSSDISLSYKVKEISEACTYPSTIKIKQQRKPCDCSDVVVTSSSSLDLTRNEQTVTSGFTFLLDNACTESVGVTVTSGASWITATSNKASSSSNDFYVTVSVLENSSYERSGIIKPIVNGFTCDDIELVVSQANACDCNQLTLTPSSVTLTSGGTSQTIAISNISECITSSAVTSSVSWLKAQLNGNSIVVSADTNNAPSRSSNGTLTYICDGTEHTKTFNVIQSGGCNCENILSVPATATTTGLIWDGNDSGTTKTVNVAITDSACLSGNVSGSCSDAHFSVSLSQTASNVVVSVSPNGPNTSIDTPITGEITLSYKVKELSGTCTYDQTIKLTHNEKICNCDDFKIIS